MAEENEKQINKDVVYICAIQKNETEEAEQKTEEKKSKFNIPFADKIKLPGGIAGKVVAGVGAAAAFAVLPATLLGTAVAGGIAAGAITLSSLLKKKENAGNTDDIQIVSVDLAEEIFKNDGIILRNISRITAGLILVKHPFLPNTYINLESTETELFHLKMLCLSTITQYLGAKSISGHAHIVEEKKRVCDAKGNVEYKAVKANADVHSEKNQRYESEYHLEDTFAGEYSEESYKLAVEEAKKFGLDKDMDITSLLEARDPNRPRNIQSRKLSIELSRELNNVLDTAFNLSTVGFDLSTGYKETLESRKKILFELEINF